MIKVENQWLGPGSTSKRGDVWLRESLKEQRKVTDKEGTKQSLEDSSGESIDKETKLIEINNEIYNVSKTVIVCEGSNALSFSVL